MSVSPAAAGLPEQRALIGDLERGNEDSNSGGHPAKTLFALPGFECPERSRRVLDNVSRFQLVLGLVLATFIVIGFVACIIVLTSNQCTEHQTQRECVQSGAAKSGKDGEVLPPCGDDWIWYRNKCYYFSKNDGNWTEAKDSCAALDSFLAMIDIQEELTFLLSHKGDPDRWIGLRRRSPDQPWMLVNGSKFNNLFTVEDYAECAYLNHGRVKSSECYNRRKWCCSKLPFL